MNKPSIVQEGNSVRVTVEGAIDEKFQFPESVNADTLILDLDGLTLFNSMGIRNWFNWSRTQKGYQTLKIENCRPIFLHQVRFLKNMLPEFAVVDSFYIPFYDPAQDSVLEVKVVRGKDFDEGNLQMPKPLDAKGEPLELDVDSNYFQFLKTK